MHIFDLPVHPDAEAFRMLPPDELQALADDIKEKGLNHPLVTTTLTAFDEVTGEKSETLVLVDGRNRREACKMAGVEPQVVDLNGKDAKDFIQSENDLRRHDTKGMRAMSYAIRFPEKSQGKKAASELNSDVSDRYVNQARTVREYCDADTVEAVLVGATTLPAAYDMAKDVRDGKQGPTDAERLAALHEVAPDLAAEVEDPDSPTTIVGAEADCEERERVARANREAGHRELRDGIYGFGSFFVTDDRISSAVELVTEYRAEFEAVCGRERNESLRYLKAMKNNIATLIKALEE